MSDHTLFEQRKQDHIKLALKSDNQTANLANLSTCYFEHEALPELDFAQITLSPNPFYVNSMTAGHPEGKNINQIIANACQVTGWAMGVGSQRRELTDPTAAEEWRKIRTTAPDVEFYGNLGLAQLIHTPLPDVLALIDNLQASAMLIHTNPLQEALQPEGTPQFAGGLAALKQLCAHSPVPVILKETGCGFAANTLTKLNNIGLAAVDMSGLGGTHWGRIEGQRAAEDSPQAQAAVVFANWGIPTLSGLLAAESLNLTYDLWASGGIRSGLDAAKCLALGAKKIGLAQPILQSALLGTPAVINRMRQFEYELRIALFCTGARELEQLRGKLRWI